MKRMLFNATQAEELRVAIVDGQKLIDLDIESAAKEQRKSQHLQGRRHARRAVARSLLRRLRHRPPRLPAVQGNRAAVPEGRRATRRGDERRGRIQDQIRKEGQELIVQVDKDERGNKGAALTTYISLAGRYLVLMPNNPRGGGVSRRVEGEDRNELRDAIAQLEVPHGMSVIARTAGIGRTRRGTAVGPELPDAAVARRRGAPRSCRPAPYLIYQESSLVIRAIRDYFHPDIGEILIDTEAIYEQAQQFMGHVMPDNVQRVKLYHDDVPLFSRFQIEHQIETAYARQVPLPSGGAIVIDHTEALVSIDVNSARATKGGDIETTAFNTNLEAADELARQLRLRDLGGLIVIDFIDMEIDEEPARGREPPARRAALRPRARAARQDLALRPDGTVAPAAAPGARRIRVHPLPALPRHRPHPRHRIDRAAHPAHPAGRGDEGQHRAGRRAGAGRRRDVPAEREARRRAVDRDALQGERAADPEPPPRDAELQGRRACATTT